MHVCMHLWIHWDAPMSVYAHNIKEGEWCMLIYIYMHACIHTYRCRCRRDIRYSPTYTCVNLYTHSYICIYIYRGGMMQASSTMLNFACRRVSWRHECTNVLLVFSTRSCVTLCKNLRTIMSSCIPHHVFGHVSRTRLGIVKTAAFHFEPANSPLGIQHLDWNMMREAKHSCAAST